MIKRIIYIAVFASLIWPSQAKGQGGWNIGYLEIDSVSTQHIGSQVQIDFKSKEDSNPQLRVRSKIYPINSGSLEINEEDILFYERRLIGVDYGYFKDQFLIEHNPKFSKIRIIKKSWIEEVNEESILLKIELETYDISGSRNENVIDSSTNVIDIKKSLLDGFLTFENR